MLVAISVLGPTPELEKTDETAELRETPFWANYRVLTVVMLLATAGLVVAFA